MLITVAVEKPPISSQRSQTTARNLLFKFDQHILKGKQIQNCFGKNEGVSLYFLWQMVSVISVERNCS